MKLLRITAEGLPLFKEKLNTYFYSQKTKEICRLETVVTSNKSKSEGGYARNVEQNMTEI